MRLLHLPTLRRSAASLALGLAASSALADPVVALPTAGASSDLATQARDFALGAAGAPGVRVAVEVGALDRRLRLAPCERVEPYLPPGVRLWGKTRIGLRCKEGAVHWNVYLPITVHVYGQALTVAAALPAGATLAAGDLRLAEVDLAAGSDPLLAAEAAVGRTLARPLAAGQVLRHGDLRLRQWFGAGDTVQVTAVGPGFRITAEGQALGPGIEGQPARVRIDNGRIVTGRPVAERRIEVSL